MLILQYLKRRHVFMYTQTTEASAATAKVKSRNLTHIAVCEIAQPDTYNCM